MFHMRSCKCSGGTKSMASMGHLCVFLLEEGIDPSTNLAERALRTAEFWRRMKQRSFNEKEDRW